MLIRIFNFLFGWNYIFIKTQGGKLLLSRLRFIEGRAFAAPFLPDTTKQILPKGEIRDGEYCIEWMPVTKGASAFYDL